MFYCLIIYNHLLSYLNCRSALLSAAHVFFQSLLQTRNPALHPFIRLIWPFSGHNRCRVKKNKKTREEKKQLNEEISKSYVYRKAPRDGAIRRGSLCSSRKPSKHTARETCVLLILSMRVQRLRLLLLLQRRWCTRRQDTHDSSELHGPASSKQHTPYRNTYHTQRWKYACTVCCIISGNKLLLWALLISHC